VTENEIGEIVIGSAIRVHTALGPGLLESAYEACLAHEIVKSGLPVRKQIGIPVIYDGLQLDTGYRLDLLIDERVVIEVKAVERILDVHKAQLLSYLRLGKFKLGYVLNFHVARMKDGVYRVVNGL